MPPGVPGMPPMWGWPGMPPADSRKGRTKDRSKGRDSRSASRSRRRSASRSRGRRSQSRSQSRGRSVDYLSFPRRIMGRVIGKQGLTIKNIRESSGAKIDCEDKDNDECELKISGNPPSVARARAMIIEVAEKNKDYDGRMNNGGTNSTADSSGNLESEIVEYPDDKMGNIIGPKGVNIQEARQLSGARITVDKHDGFCDV